MVRSEYRRFRWALLDLGLWAGLWTLGNGCLHQTQCREEDSSLPGTVHNIWCVSFCYPEVHVDPNISN
jgi:hypothetical protein